MKKLLSLTFVVCLLFSSINFHCFAQKIAIRVPSTSDSEALYEGKSEEKLKIVGVIPARYQSSRFPGKPLADICGKPMIWWVYQQAKKVKELDKVYVATDDKRIEDVCKQYDMDVVMTPNDIKTCTERVYEAALHIEADIYVAINGDEPLINPNVIQKVIPESIDKSDCFVKNLICEITNPVEVIDFTNIKVVTDAYDNVSFMSRSPIPYPKASMDYKYLKHLGIMSYNFKALEFFKHTPRSFYEAIEDVDYLRFVENGKKVKTEKVKLESLSVDTPKDLERVRAIMTERLNKKCKILDCTLRDGGYINNWNFGEDATKGIIDNLVNSNVDIIECGFIGNQPYEKDSTYFSDINQINKYIEEKGNNQLFVGMMCADCVSENMPVCSSDVFIKGIRLLFKKNEIDLAMQKTKILQQKGYEVFLQPAAITDYSDVEIKDLIYKVNKMKPLACYIVDTFGIMSKKELLHVFSLFDENLSPEISIGFHSHNNLQLSFASSQELINLNTERQLIIDSSVLGMGRGAGNLCTELIMQYLNESTNSQYNINPIYTIIDKYLKRIYEKTPWGYSVPFFISAKYNCHPNYVIFLKEQGINETEIIDELISKVPESKKTNFDKSYIKNVLFEKVG